MKDGLLNQMLANFHIPPTNWLGNPDLTIYTISLLAVWQFGSSMVIFLAALQNIPTQYYEALEIDGGNWWYKLKDITIPMMTPTIFFNTIMLIITSFQAFDKAYILTEGGPNNGSLFYVYLLWREAFRSFRFGHASALAWILFLVIVIFTAIIFKNSSWVYYEGGDKK
jgi:multiple sugar transport system permease protein